MLALPLYGLQWPTTGTAVPVSAQPTPPEPPEPGQPHVFIAGSAGVEFQEENGIEDPQNQCRVAHMIPLLSALNS